MICIYYDLNGINTIMILQEIFNNPTTYEWTHGSPGRYGAQFRTPEGQTIKVDFLEQNQDQWAVQFQNMSVEKGREQKITDTGEEHVIFATVLKIMNEFIRDMNPQRLIFSAEEPSRQKLYDTMIRRLGADWEVKKFDEGDATRYFLIRKH